ncbi:MAG: BON domain-containing protein [Gammaproteobacteria bacterium]|nr:BON domain-containing protein [Gammaproteobacteria bacterium]
MLKSRINTYLLILSLIALNGCAAVAVTGVAAGASVASDKRTTGTVIEDQAIELKASEAIFSDRDLRQSTHINFTSFNTVVLVTGEAPTEDMRNKIIDIARNIEKVSSVHNEITIAAPSSFMSRSSDSVITSKVKAKLVTDKTASALNTKVVTEKGVVYLMGLLTRARADAATEIARTTGGVQKVVRLFQYTD